MLLENENIEFMPIHQDYLDKTPLIFTIGCRNTNIVQMLLEKFSDIDLHYECYDGVSAYSCAKEYGIRIL